MSAAPDFRRRDVDPMPSNVEAEFALLGTLLYDNAALERVDDILRPEHFYEEFHGRLYDVIRTIVRKGHLADPSLLVDRFKHDPAFIDLGERSFLAELVMRAPAIAYAADYARAIRDMAVRRELIRFAGDVEKEAKRGDGLTGKEQVEAAEQRLYEMGETGGTQNAGMSTFSTALAGALDLAALAYSRDGKLSGLSTGLMDLDSKLGGLHSSDLIVIAARPSMGKTALGLNIAFNAAKRYAWEPHADGSRKTVSGAVVGFWSLEMSEEQLAMRVLAETAGVPSDKVRKGEITASDYGRIRDASVLIQESPLYIDDTGGISIGKLAARARRMKRTTGLDLIVVDYIQLVTTDGGQRRDNRVQEVSEITQGLKALAKELSVPVVALAQLSRQVEAREDKRPMLQDLRESGSIEQDADVVIFIYREEYYLARTEPRGNGPEYEKWHDAMQACRGTAELIVGKQRHGPIGTVRAAWNENLTRFSDLVKGIDSSTHRMPFGED